MSRSAWASIVAVSLLLSSSYAVPVLQFDHGKTHRIPVSGSSVGGIAAVNKMYNKYNIPTPQGFIDAVGRGNEVTAEQKDTKTGDNKVSSAPAGGHGNGAGQVVGTLANDNAEYLCPVKIGSQTFNMVLDTGSSDFWVFNSLLPEKYKGNHTIYDPAQSASHTSVNGYTFKVEYGDNSTTIGDVGTDTVIIAGVTVPYQPIELPKSFNNDIAQTLDDPSDGIVGLGFQKYNSIIGPDGKADPRPTWFENAKSALMAGVFTANLKKGAAGYFNFGSVDATAAKGDITYTSIDSSSGFWQVQSASYKIGKGESTSYTKGKLDTIADSGSSVLLLQSEVVKAFYQGVRGVNETALESTGQYYVPCDSALPDLTLGLGDYSATMKGDSLMYSPQLPGMCMGGVQSNQDSGLQILGDIFFQSFFVVFDYDNARIGFAPHA